MSGEAAVDMGHDCSDGSGRKPQRLTRNEELVLSVLKEQTGPMKAYELLAALKDHGIKAPMTVYRALDRLEAKGYIHKLDAMNAFLVCNHDTPHPMQTFIVCSTCSRVEEVPEANVTGLNWNELQALAKMSAFTAQSARIELRGVCSDCV